MTLVLPLLSSDDRAALMCAGRARHVPRGGWLMSQGDEGDAVSVIIHGRVKISTVTADGADVVCAVHGPGSIIGHFEAIDSDGLGRTASAIALEAVECRVLSGGEFRAFLLQHPGSMMALLRTTIRDLRTAHRRRADVASGDVTRHLARFLLEQVQQGEPNGQADRGAAFGLSQAELAGVVSASRAAVVRGLSALRKRGAVATSPRQIVVTDVTALREAAR